MERNDIVRRLKIAWEVENQAQPQLQTWLKDAKAETLGAKSIFESAWETAQKVAQPLAQIFTILAKPHFQGRLLVQCETSDMAYWQALAAVVLGDVERQIEIVVETWLQQQIINNTGHNEVLNIFKGQQPAEQDMWLPLATWLYSAR